MHDTEPMNQNWLLSKKFALKLAARSEALNLVKIL